MTKRLFTIKVGDNQEYTEHSFTDPAALVHFAEHFKIIKDFDVFIVNKISTKKYLGYSHNTYDVFTIASVGPNSRIKYDELTVNNKYVPTKILCWLETFEEA